MKYIIPPISVVLLAFTSYADTNGPIEDGVARNLFFAPHHEALTKLEGKTAKIDETEMIHLGLPTEAGVVIWYSLADGADARIPFEVFILDPQAGETRVPAAQLEHWANATHHTGRINVIGLAPDTSYRLGIQGGGLRSRRVIQAATKPKKKEPFSFIAASCFLPWNYSEPKLPKTFITQETTAVLRSLVARSRARQERGSGPSFYLGLGDQIYVDPGADEQAEIAYLYGDHSEKMRGKLAEAPQVLKTLYRYHFGLQPMDRAFSQLPSVMMWDDHDIRDGWGSQYGEGKTGWQDYYKVARESFLAFQASRNPEFSPKKSEANWTLSPEANREPVKSGHERAGDELDIKFSWGAAEFFVMDGRSDRKIDGKKAQSYSEHQFERFKCWLKALEVRDEESLVFTFCFPVPLAGGDAIAGNLVAKFHTSDSDDARDRAYVIEKERNELLEALLSHANKYKKHRLLILSGDVHYSGIQVLKDPNSKRILGYEIVSSGLAQTEFNSDGPFWVQVGKPLEVGKPVIKVNLADHGFYAGSSFAEIFIGPAQTAEPPEVRVLFYPAAERPSKMRGSRLKQFSTLHLDVSNVDFDFARRPECYPENTPRFNLLGRRVTASHLAEYIILDQWLGSGRATRGGEPTRPAVSW